MKPIDRVIYRMIASQRAVMKMNVKVAPKVIIRRPSPRPEGEGRMVSRNLTETIDSCGGVEATAR